MFTRITMKTLSAAALAIALAGLGAPTAAQVAPKISLDQLQTMFANMRAQTHWNLDGPMLWGFFFLDSDRAKLEAAQAELTSKGYRFVAIQKVNGSENYRLHVERVEVHTPQTLYARDIELEGLARKLHVRSYDGMDVGPAPTADGAAASAATH